jgi:hypothetical protein
MAGISFGQDASSYFGELSPSFRESLSNDIEGAGNIGDSFFQKLQTNQELPFLTEEIWGIDENLSLPGLEGLGALGSQPAWTFITAPEDVSWDIANNAQRIDVFGTNNPPVVAGSRGMRDLQLGNALVEGFVRNVQVEGKVAALENLLNYNLNPSDGFVSVPVYQVWANSKSYGGPEAYYIIKDVKVKEAMRDLKGNATRAYVDISLMQVPAYQVNSGRDQASAVTAGAKSGLISDAQTRAIQQSQQAKDAAAKQADGAKQSDVANPANRSGPKAPEPDKPKEKTADNPTTRRIVGVSQAPKEED